MPLQYLEETTSTNIYLKENLHLFESSFSGVYTFKQTMGKGQRGTVWVSEPDKNIALSFCLNKEEVRKIVNLSFWCSLIIRNFIQEVTKINTLIKWPNDIILNNKKVCGILIESKNNWFIIGMGINVMQENFDNFPKASSLHLTTHTAYDLHSLTKQLLTNFNNSLSLLNSDYQLITQYNSHLFRKDIPGVFKFNNSLKNGIIREVDANGLLTIEFDYGKIKKFTLKEIELLY